MVQEKEKKSNNTCPQQKAGGKNIRRILSLDGGGIKGYMTALMLRKLNKYEPIKGWLDNVDLYAGTSTGGIIALGLAAGMKDKTNEKTDIDVIIDLYKLHSEKVFEDKLNPFFEIPLFKSDYSNKGLLSEICSTINDKPIRELNKKVLIPSFHMNGYLRFSSNKYEGSKARKSKRKNILRMCDNQIVGVEPDLIKKRESFCLFCKKSVVNSLKWVGKKVFFMFLVIMPLVMAFFAVDYMEKITHVDNIFLYIITFHFFLIFGISILFCMSTVFDGKVEGKNKVRKKERNKCDSHINKEVYSKYRENTTLKKTWKPKIFHNIGKNADSDSVIDVALCTSAAPTYFPVYKEYVDGGIYANNPSLIALAKIIKETNNLEEELGQIKMLSMGTGMNHKYDDKTDQKSHGLFYWFSDKGKLINMMMDASSSTVAYQAKSFLQERYHRIDYDLTDFNIELDSISEDELEIMEAIVEKKFDILKCIYEKYGTVEYDETEDSIRWIECHFCSNDN